MPVLDASSMNCIFDGRDSAYTPVDSLDFQAEISKDTGEILPSFAEECQSKLFPSDAWQKIADCRNGTKELVELHTLGTIRSDKI